MTLTVTVFEVWPGLKVSVPLAGRVVGPGGGGAVGGRPVHGDRLAARGC